MGVLEAAIACLEKRSCCHRQSHSRMPGSTNVHTIGKISWAPPSVEASQPTRHPRSGFADDCRRACLLIIRLSQVMVPVGFDGRAELFPAAPDVYHRPLPH